MAPPRIGRRPGPGARPRIIQAVPPSLLAIALVTALLTLLPARRLFVAGWSSATTAAFYLAVWLLSIVVLTVPGRSRFLVPVLLVAWVVPFVLSRDAVARWLRRRSPGPQRVVPQPPAPPPVADPHTADPSRHQAR